MAFSNELRKKLLRRLKSNLLPPALVYYRAIFLIVQVYNKSFDSKVVMFADLAEINEMKSCIVSR